MKNCHPPAALLLALFLMLGAIVHRAAAGDANRQRVLLDADWRFQGIANPPPPNDLDCARPDFDDAKWRVLHLPHDYVLEGAFTPAAPADHGSLVAGAAWYRKEFELSDSAKGKAIWIDFDGVYRNSDVFLNGVKLGHHASGYTSFRYDISEAAKFGGANVLAVRTDASQPEGWWYEGGGIYRHVWLNIASPVHVAPWGVFVSSELPEPGSDGIAPHAKVVINVSLVCKDMPRYEHLAWQVPYAPGRLEARAFTGGKLIATDQVETTGAPAALRLTTDRTELNADGEDVTMVAVDVVDARDRIVPTADNEITFSVRGPAHVTGTGNGDPSSHEPDKATRRHALNGRCLVLVGADVDPGAIELTASAAGLPAGTVDLTAGQR
jgi:hypothetical protein